MTRLSTDRRFTAGALSGLGSAILFGLSAPLAKVLLPQASPWLLAGLLYLGAGVGLSLLRLAMTQNSRADRLRREDVPRLLAIILSGGAVGPVLLLVGLTRVSGVVGSLLLNLEAVFTMTLAVFVYHERLGRLESLGAFLVVGGAVVVTGRPESWHANLLGALAIVGACFAWAFNNNLTRQISFRDPIQLVQVKTLSAGIGNVVLAAVAGHRAPAGVVPAALLLGFVLYGLNIVLDATHSVSSELHARRPSSPWRHLRAHSQRYRCFTSGLPHAITPPGILMALGIVLLVRGRQ